MTADRPKAPVATRLPARLAGLNSPLARALAVSLALHATILLPLRWPFSADIPPAGQIQILASLVPAAPHDGKPRDKPKSEKPGEGKSAGNTGDAKPRLTAPGTPAPLAAPPAGSESPPEDAPLQDAQRLDFPQPPDYPPEALARKLEGCVLALVTVSGSGAVSKVQILESDHPGVFDETMINAQKDARYLAASRNGEAVESRVLAVAAFVLDPARKMNCALKYAPIAEKLVRGGNTQ